MNKYDNVNEPPETDTPKADMPIPDPKLTFQEALTVVGAFHFYQKRVFLIFGLQWFLMNQVLFSPILLFRDPIVDCLDDLDCNKQCENEVFNQQCQQFICMDNSNHKFLHSPYLTTAFQQVLNCQPNLLAAIKSMVYFGSFIGLMIFPSIADNYGRKITLQLSWAFCTIGLFILLVAQSLYIVSIGLFLAGFGGNPTLTIQFSFINEHSQGSFREMQNVGVQIFFVLGEITLIMIGLLVSDWRLLALIIFLPVTLLNFSFKYIFESPQFLYSKDREHCLRVLNQIAVLNKKQPILDDQLEDNMRSSQLRNRSHNFMDLLRYGSVRKVLICGCFLIFGIQLIYYGISYASTNLGFGLYTNLLIIAIFELVSFTLTSRFIQFMERKKTIVVGLIILGFLSLFYFLEVQNEQMRFTQGTIAGIMRFFICVVWAVAQIFIAESLPSPVRSMTLGLINAGGQIGSFSQTFAINWSKDMMHPMTMFGVVGLICALIIIPMKETRNQPLCDYIEEEQYKSVVDQFNVKVDIVEEQELEMRKRNI